MIARGIGALSRATRLAAGLILVGMTAFILVEILLRLLRGTGTNVLVEFIGYALAGMTFLAASGTMRDGGMVRIGLVLSRVPAGVRRILDMFCVLCGIATVGTATFFVTREMWQSFQRGYETDSLVALPSWLPPVPLLLGMVVFLLDMLLQLALVASGRLVLPDDSPDAI
jgi:TRAP-type C4-dicarboxylate transport system permease small subunit